MNTTTQDGNGHERANGEETRIETVESLTAALEAERGRHDKTKLYLKKIDGIIEEVGGVTASCINPYEDMKRALIGQKERAERAETALKQGKAIPENWKSFVREISQCSGKMLEGNSIAARADTLLTSLIDSPVDPGLPEMTIYLEAYAASDVGGGPVLAEVECTPSFVERLQRMQQLCVGNGLSEARCVGAPKEWGQRGISDDLRLSDHELVVVPSGNFWFVASVKHGDYHVETRAISITELIDAAKSALSLGEDFALAGWENEDALEYVEEFRESDPSLLSNNAP